MPDRLLLVTIVFVLLVIASVSLLAYNKVKQGCPAKHVNSPVNSTISISNNATTPSINSSENPNLNETLNNASTPIGENP